MATLSKAIVDHFNADTDLATSCPGGLTYGRAAKGTSEPYCELQLPGGFTQMTTGPESADDQQVVFNIYGRTYAAVDTALWNLINLFDRRADSIVGVDNATIEGWIRTGPPETRELSQDPLRLVGTVVYELKLSTVVREG